MSKATPARAAVVGLVTLCACAIGAVAGTSVAGAACFRVAEPHHGAWEAACMVAGGEEEYINAYTNRFVRRSEPGVYCAQVETAEVSWYANRTCTGTPAQGVSLYTRVKAMAVGRGIGPLMGKALKPQVYLFSLGRVECEHAAIEGESKAEEFTALTVPVRDSTCTGFGTTDLISEADYEFDTEGAMGVSSKNILITDKLANCTLTIASGGSNKTLDEVEYVDSTSKKIEANINLKAIHYEASGGACGAAKKLETNGALLGSVAIET